VKWPWRHEFDRDEVIELLAESVRQQAEITERMEKAICELAKRGQFPSSKESDA
jgi:hypothetical protein